MNKSILLVGNGGSLIGSNLGNKIDEFDEVIRINEGKTKGWERDAGMRFTIWSTYNPEAKFNKFVKGYKSRNYSEEQIEDLLKELRELWYLSPRLDHLHPWNYKLYNLEKLVKRHESPVIMREISRTIKEPTTGFILIYLLSKMYDKFYITGFDFLGHSHIKPQYHHYFGNNPVENVEKEQILIRDLDGEYNYTKSLVDNNKIIYLKEDTDIEKSVYIGKDLIKRTCKCGKESQYYWWENRICHYCEEYL